MTAAKKRVFIRTVQNLFSKGSFINYRLSSEDQVSPENNNGQQQFVNMPKMERYLIGEGWSVGKLGQFGMYSLS